MKNIALVGILFSQTVLAGNCVITTTRYACPGQEAVSYAKCPGEVQTCSVTAATDNAQECEAAAINGMQNVLDGCINHRIQVTKYKKVTATFNGQDFANGEDFCAQDSGSYVVKENFPYKDQPSCN